MKPTVRLIAASSTLLLGSQASAQQLDGESCQQSVCPLRRSSAPQAASQQGEPAQAPQPHGELQVQGNVSQVAGQGLKVVEPDTGRILKLEVEKSAQITREGQPIDLNQIREGSEVRVSYRLRGNEHVADRVEVRDQGPTPAEIVEQGQAGQSPLFAVRGRVTDKSNADQDFKVVDPDRRLAVTLDLGEQTAFLVDGSPVPFDKLELGQQVKATYRASESGHLVAQQVESFAEVQPSKPTPASPPSPTAEQPPGPPPAEGSPR